MLKNIFLILIAVSVGLAGANSYAMNKSDLQGKVTSIKGNLITVTTDKGQKITTEVQSVEGIRVGDRAWCEEDCGKGMKIGEKTVNVKKMMK